VVDTVQFVAGDAHKSFAMTVSNITFLNLSSRSRMCEAVLVQVPKNSQSQVKESIEWIFVIAMFETNRKQKRLESQQLTIPVQYLFVTSSPWTFGRGVCLAMCWHMHAHTHMLTFVAREHILSAVENLSF
jgi:hypothetical protein